MAYIYAPFPFIPSQREDRTQVLFLALLFIIEAPSLPLNLPGTLSGTEDEDAKKKGDERGNGMYYN